VEFAPGVRIISEREVIDCQLAKVNFSIIITICLELKKGAQIKKLLILFGAINPLWTFEVSSLLSTCCYSQSKL